MKETKIYCDHCGKSIDPMVDFDDITIEMSYKFINVDLCYDCLYNLYEIVSDFVNKKE
jgi:hypothetical protein